MYHLGLCKYTFAQRRISQNVSPSSDAYTYVVSVVLTDTLLPLSPFNLFTEHVTIGQSGHVITRYVNWICLFLLLTICHYCLKLSWLVLKFISMAFNRSVNTMRMTSLSHFTFCLCTVCNSLVPHTDSRLAPSIASVRHSPIHNHELVRRGLIKECYSYF